MPCRDARRPALGSSSGSSHRCWPTRGRRTGARSRAHAHTPAVVAYARHASRPLNRAQPAPVRCGRKRRRSVGLSVAKRLSRRLTLVLERNCARGHASVCSVHRSSGQRSLNVWIRGVPGGPKPNCCRARGRRRSPARDTRCSAVGDGAREPDLAAFRRVEPKWQQVRDRPLDDLTWAPMRPIRRRQEPGGCIRGRGASDLSRARIRPACGG